MVCRDVPRPPDRAGSGGQIEDRRVITYGENPQADFCVKNIDLTGGQSRFSLEIRDRKTGQVTLVPDLMMPMPGHHNALNATAAIAVAHELGVKVDVIRSALAGFAGVKRRFTKTGEWNGVQIFDDYGHHPVEIAAVLRAARASTKGKVVAVVQPHRYTRLQSLFSDFAACFNDADSVIVADVYSAGESPIEGASRDDLVSAIKARGHRHVIALEGRTSSRDMSPVLPSPAIMSCCSARATSPMGLCLAGRTRGENRVSETLAARLSALMPDLRGRLLANEPLAAFTWLRVGGPAEALFTPADTDDLAYFLKHLPADIPVTVIGLASNMIIRDGGIPGVVIRFSPRAFGQIKVEEGHRIRAGAFAADRKVAIEAAEAGIGGLEFLFGIPGSVGGALRMNAGTRSNTNPEIEGETRERFVEATAVTRAGEIIRLGLKT